MSLQNGKTMDSVWISKNTQTYYLQISKIKIVYCITAEKCLAIEKREFVFVNEKSCHW